MRSSTIVVTDNTVKPGITLPKSMIQKIDTKRGDIPGAGIFDGRLKGILVVIVVVVKT